jgi:putative membrane protein
MGIHELPTLNAILNGTAAALMSCGFFMIRRRAIRWHRNLMLAALACSALFLTSYLIYHYQTGTHPYPGHGPTRSIYLTILLTHTLLAITLVPMVIITLYRALRRDFTRHRRIARYTLPMWFYVSVTGVIIYLMLYGLP